LTTDENDIVLDPFSGTGTTAISAKRLGRKYIGFELDMKYVEISQQKLENTKSNYKIGNNWVSFYLNDIITIRNNDWKELVQYFIIPETKKSIDSEKAKLRDKKLIPSNEIIIEEEESISEENLIVNLPIMSNGKRFKTALVKNLSPTLFATK